MRVLLIVSVMLSQALAEDLVPDWYPVYRESASISYLDNYDLDTKHLIFRTYKAPSNTNKVKVTLLLYSEGYDVRGVWSLERINLQNYELICKKGDEDSADSQTFDIAFNEEPLSWEVHGDGSVMMNGEKKCSNLLTENDVTHINVKGGDIKLEVTPPTGATRCPPDQPYAYNNGEGCCSVNVGFGAKKNECKQPGGGPVIGVDCPAAVAVRVTPCFNNPVVVSCPDHHYKQLQSTDMESEICVSCPAGEYVNNEQYGCAECPAGSYKADDMNECGVCPHNTVSTGGAALCTPCEAGKEPNYERTECGLCPAGRYKTSSMNECAECPDNKISTEGAVSCTPCEAGQGPNSEQSACESCGEGTYRDDNMLSCAKCDAGKQPNTGQTACDQCEAGTVKGSSDTECKRCENGMEPDFSRSACAECPAGSYKADDMNECAVCPDNKISTGGTALCTICEAGKEPNSDRTECESCAVGSYKSNDMNECAECSDNMVSEEGADSCTTCEAGKGPNSDQSACVRYCPELTNGDIAYIFPNISLSPPDGKVKVKCIAGHVVKGSRVLSCTTDGTWNQSPLPSCKKYGMFIRLIWYV